MVTSRVHLNNVCARVCFSPPPMCLYIIALYTVHVAQVARCIILFPFSPYGHVFVMVFIGYVYHVFVKGLLTNANIAKI